MSDLVSSEIEAVVFDVDGTLYRQAPVRAAMAAELLAYAATTRSARIPNILRAFRAVREQLRERPRDSAAPLDQLQYEVTGEACGEPAEHVRAVVAEWMLQRPLKYLRAAQRRSLTHLIAQLHRNRVPLAVFSDYPAESKLQALGLEHRFDVVLAATDPDVDAFKPHPQGFRRVCERLQLPPNAVAYVGDRRSTDAAGAAAAGMPWYLVGHPFSRIWTLYCEGNAHGSGTYENLRELCRTTA